MDCRRRIATGTGIPPPGWTNQAYGTIYLVRQGCRGKVPAMPTKNVAASAGSGRRIAIAADDAGSLRPVASALFGRAAGLIMCGPSLNRSLFERHRNQGFVRMDARSVLGGTQGVESPEEFSLLLLFGTLAVLVGLAAQVLQFPGFLGTDPGRPELGNQLVGGGDLARPRWPDRPRRTDSGAS